MNLAKEVHLLNEATLTDTHKLNQLKEKLDAMVRSEKEGEEGEPSDIKHYFKRIDKKFNRQKVKHEEKLFKLAEEYTTHQALDYSEAAAHTSIMQKALKQVISEIWSQVIP
jgi:predicted solute-binding protein